MRWRWGWEGNEDEMGMKMMWELRDWDTRKRTQEKSRTRKHTTHNNAHNLAQPEKSQPWKGKGREKRTAAGKGTRTEEGGGQKRLNQPTTAKPTPTSACFVTSLDYRPLPNVRGHLSRRIMPRTPCSSIFQVRHVVFGRNTLFAGGCWQEIVAAGSQQILSLVTQHATVSSDRWFPLVLILHGRRFLVPLNRNQWVFRV